jgi:hypothetical protein
MASAAAFMKNHKPKETTLDRLVSEIKAKKKDADIKELLKKGYSNTQIKEFLQMNKITASTGTLNKYINELSKELKLNRQPIQLKIKKEPNTPKK